MDPVQNTSRRGMWLVLIMTGMCMTMVAYNTTAVVTVLPIIARELDLRPATLQWVMVIYMVSAASLMAVMGRSGDIFGKMRVFVFGIAAFALGSTLAGFALNGDILLLGRLTQGIGAAAMFGTSLSVLTVATPEADRTFVMGLWGALIALGMSLGPIIGGLFGQYLSWRWIFYLDLSVIALSLILIRIVSKENYVPHRSSTSESLDYLGAVLIVLTLAPLAFGLSQSEVAGWSQPLTLVPLGISVVSALAFYWRQSTAVHPLLQLGYFRHPRFMAATAGIFVSTIVLMGFFYYFNIFVQSPDTFAMSPVVAGAAVLPLTGMMLICSIVAPKILGPYSFRWPVTAGMLLLALGSYLLSMTTNTSTYSDIWWQLLLLGAGLGMTLPLLPRVGLRVLAEKHAGQGSGMINTFLNFGASIGAVVCGFAYMGAIKNHLATIVQALPSGSVKRDGLVSAISQGSNNEIQTALAALDPATTQILETALRDVQDDAFSAAMLVCAACTLVGALLVCYLMRGPVPDAGSASDLVNAE